MKVYNTLTRQKEPFVTIEKNKVKLYACGPTVYNYIHIGNARPICVFDVLRRYLEYKGYEVIFVQNFTDIDDKLIKKAQDEGISVAEIADRYIKEYEIDAKGLGVRPATFHPKATDVVDDIIQIIKTLIDKNYAYELSGDVYFRTRKFEQYGKLSNMPLDQLDANYSDRAQIKEINLKDTKEDGLDFALWKNAKPHEPSWTSPWGNGRPGWHIECTAMIKKYLGTHIDLHCGGQDLVFPHHENEIAQGECCFGGEYANYWMHNGFINIDNKKMSKSLGNFFTTRDVAEKFGYEPIKFMMLQSHYRSPINYSYDVIEQCQSALSRLYTCRNHMEFCMQNATDDTSEDLQFNQKVMLRKEQFITAMDDDLNTADGIAVLFDLSRDVNSYLTELRSKPSIVFAMSIFDEFCDVLGILYQKEKVDDLEHEIELLIEERQQARKNKDFKRSDEIRDNLLAKGIILEDTSQGVKWRKA